MNWYIVATIIVIPMAVIGWAFMSITTPTYDDSTHNKKG